jgi:hypothetical protein
VNIRRLAEHFYAGNPCPETSPKGAVGHEMCYRR